MPEMMRFQGKTNDERYDEIITYNQIIDKFEAEDGDNAEWRFNAIADNKGPLQKNHPKYRGSKWNFQIHWKNDEVTWELLVITTKNDSITCAFYARHNNLVDYERRKQFHRLTNR